jgi:hypothetical protein
MSRGIALLSGLLVIVGLVATANAELIQWSGTGTGWRTDNAGTIGNLITIGNSPITINALGVQDKDGDGFIYSPIQVGLWSADGSALLRSTTVASTDTLLAGNYRYASVASYTLQANTQYLIGALVGKDYEAFGDSNTSPGIGAAVYTGTTGVTITSCNYGGWEVGTFTAPVNDGGPPSGRWAPANAIPEPATMALLGLGVLGVLLRRRRR